MTAPRVAPLGEAAWLVALGDTVDPALNDRVLLLADAIRQAGFPWVRDVVTAYASLAVHVDPAHPATAAEASLTAVARDLPAAAPRVAADPTVIPVRYDGPDLAWVAEQTGLAVADVIRRHAEPTYRVYAVGFVPGFAYLGPLDPALVLPRRAEPRRRVPAGSVAIAGAQTGIYPAETPGGWHLIGRTDLVLFDPARDPPALLAAGASVRFEPVP